MRYKLIHFISLIAVLAAFSAVAPVAFGQKMSMLEIERRLNDLGYWITKVDGRSDASTRQAIIAFQKVERRKRTGLLNASDMALLQNASRPQAKYASGPAHIEVDIGRQVLFYVGDDGTVLKIIAVSTGNEQKYFDEGEWQTAHTTRGSFKVQWKYNGERKASLGTLYYPSYFNGGIAIHGSPSIPPYPASHGCVRVPRFADKAIYKMMPVGMPVYVYDHI
jgi:L,D-transpeptidase catalytic domain/Putative peptidoglycan binding domain